MRFKSKIQWIQVLAYMVIAMGLGGGIWFVRDQWLPWLNSGIETNHVVEEDSLPVEEIRILKLSEQARINLGLVAKPAMAQTYWRKIEIPGVIAERPGITDNGITTPVVGVVAQIHVAEGDLVEPDQKLFTIRLVS
jgi:multidrug efflux pump subunit AcrA (membrane-fusion protein)